MKKVQLNYFLSLVVVLILGILSRKISGIPLFIGDMLYAILIYFGCRFLFTNYNKSTSLLFALLFCFGIEFFQLVQMDWLITIRKTTLGRYILGQGFLWTDLLCYLIGAVIAYYIDLFISFFSYQSNE